MNRLGMKQNKISRLHNVTAPVTFYESGSLSHVDDFHKVMPMGPDRKSDNLRIEQKLLHISASELFEECRRELENKNYGYDMIVHNKICYLLVQLIRIWKERGFDI